MPDDVGIYNSNVSQRLLQNRWRQTGGLSIFYPYSLSHRQNQGNTKDKKYPFSPSHIPYQPAGGDIHRKEGTEKLNASDNLPGAQRGVHQPHSFNQSRHHGKSRQQDIIRLNSDTTTADTHTQQSRQISPRRQMDDRESGAEFFTCIFTGTRIFFNINRYYFQIIAIFAD